MSIFGVLSAQQPTASGERKRADGRSVTGVVARLAMTLAALGLVLGGRSASPEPARVSSAIVTAATTATGAPVAAVSAPPGNPAPAPSAPGAALDGAALVPLAATPGPVVTPQAVVTTQPTPVAAAPAPAPAAPAPPAPAPAAPAPAAPAPAAPAPARVLAAAPAPAPAAPAPAAPAPARVLAAAPAPAPAAPAPAAPAPTAPAPAAPAAPAAPVSAPAPAAPAPAAKPASAAWQISVGGWSRSIISGGQGAIDGCGPAVLWESALPGAGGTTHLAGHNYCGFQFWRDLPIGTTVTITHGTTVFAYRIVGHVYVPRQGGSSGGLIHNDLTLQTCEGEGTSLTYADRIR